MKRILQVAVTLNGEGIANYLYNYLTHMNLQNISIDVVINKTNNKGIYEDELKKIGINIYKVTSYEKSTKKWLKDIDDLMKNKHYDIVEGHVGIRSNLLCKLAKRNNISKRIIHTHIAYEPEKIIKKLTRIIFNNIYSKYVTNYFGCSDDSLDWTFGKLKNRKKSFIINNAIDTKKFEFNKKYRDEYRNKFNLKNSFTIGCVGRLCFQKNQLFLIEIFNEIIKLHENSTLILIGDGPDKKEIVKKVNEYNLQNKVILTGIRSDVNKFLNAFDSFVLPSRYEGFGIVYLEAELNNLSCFATKERVPKSVKISNYMHFISENKNAKIWAKKILENSESRENIISNSNKQFDIVNQAKKLENIYLNL